MKQKLQYPVYAVCISCPYTYKTHVFNSFAGFFICSFKRKCVLKLQQYSLKPSVFIALHLCLSLFPCSFFKFRFIGFSPKKKRFSCMKHRRCSKQNVWRLHMDISESSFLCMLILVVFFPFRIYPNRTQRPGLWTWVCFCVPCTTKCFSCEFIHRHYRESIAFEF